MFQERVPSTFPDTGDISFPAIEDNDVELSFGLDLMSLGASHGGDAAGSDDAASQGGDAAGSGGTAGIGGEAGNGGDATSQGGDEAGNGGAAGNGGEAVTGSVGAEARVDKLAEFPLAAEVFAETIRPGEREQM